MSRATLLGAAAVAAAFVLARLGLLTNAAIATIHPEEGYLPAAAWVGRWAGPEALVEAQYRTYCAGCSVEAGLYAVLVGFLPDSVLTWRLLPATLGSLGAVGTWLALERAHGARVAAVGALLAVGAPGVAVTLSLVGWGNHAEASAIALLALGLLARAERAAGVALAGWVAGVAAAFGFIAGFAVLAGLVVASDVRRGRAAWLAGVALGGIGVGAYPAVTGRAPWLDFAWSGHFGSADGVLDAAGLLVGGRAWRALAAPLGTTPDGTVPTLAAVLAATLVVAGLVAGASRGATRTDRLGAAAALVFLAAHTLGPFQAETDRVPLQPIHARYALPWVLLGPWLAGSAIGAARGLARSGLAAAALAWAALGLAGQGAALGPVSALHDVATTPPADWSWFRRHVGALRVLADVRCADPRCATTRDVLAGRADPASPPPGPAGAAGAGLATLSRGVEGVEADAPRDAIDALRGGAGLPEALTSAWLGEAWVHRMGLAPRARPCPDPYAPVAAWAAGFHAGEGGVALERPTDPVLVAAWDLGWGQRLASLRGPRAREDGPGTRAFLSGVEEGLARPWALWPPDDLPRCDAAPP